MEIFDTPFVIVFMRIRVDTNDPGDVAAVDDLQDQMSVEAASANPFVLMNYDLER